MSLEIPRVPDTQVDLTELERDALAELANIGVSRAAANLRKMVGKQVLLSVPSVEVLNQKTAAALVGEREGDKLVAVRQTFSGSFSGRALLIFPQAKSLELIRAITGDAGDRRCRRRSTGGDRQRHSQWLPRDDGEHPASNAHHIIARGRARNRCTPLRD